MLSLLILFLVISSGSFLGSFVFQRRYEEVLPITISSIILVMFVFGILDLLSMSIIVVLTLSLLAYVISIGVLIRKGNREQNHNFQNSIYLFLTPGSITFVLTIIMCSIFVSGKVFDLYDELSHWGDVVKAMVITDKMSLHAETNCLFQSYPPTMALFQYLYQKIGILVGEFSELSEWRCVLSYNIFVLSFAMPIFKKIEWKDWWRAPAVMAVVMLTPLVFYLNAFTSIMIDFSIAAIVGAGIMMIITYEKDDTLYLSNMAGICFCLVLLKDAGLLFAVLLALCTFVITVAENKEENVTKKQEYKRNIKNGIILMGSVLLPKIAWKIAMWANDTPKRFPIHITFDDLSSLFSGGEANYRKLTFARYLKKIISDGPTIGDTDIKITYLVLFISFIACMYFVLSHFENRKNLVSTRKWSILILSILMVVFHIIGLCFTYLFIFNEYEALTLASFERYIHIPFCALLISLVYSILSIRKEKKILFGLFLLVVILSPMEYVCSYFAKTTVKYSISERQQYDEITEKIDEYCNASDRVLLISDDDGFDFCNIRFILRPKEGCISWIEKEEQGILPEHWINDSIDKYDYIAIYDMNESFKEEYGMLFERQEEISNDNLYKYDNTKNVYVKIA